jgi:two-component sensor histidine kinase
MSLKILPNQFSQQSITYIFIIGIIILFLFFSVFSFLVIYEEYSLFNKKVSINIQHENRENIFDLHEIISKIDTNKIEIISDKENKKIYFLAEAPIQILENSSTINTKQEEKKELIRFLLDAITLALIIFLIVISVTYILESTIKQEITKIINFFKFHDKNSKKSCEIDNIKLLNIKNINFYEFKLLGIYANKMVKSLYKKNLALKNLNDNLEEKVRLKTKNIENKRKDLEEAKKLKEKLIYKQEKFIKYAIHETSTPIAVILSYIDLFKMKQGENRYLNRIESGAKMIQNIYNELSFLIQTDRLKFTKENIDLSFFLKERLDFFNLIANENKLFFNTKINNNININFNRTKLSRIIDNNITNAIKYSFPNNEIYIQLTEENHKIIFLISTNSPQINNYEKIFDTYYREDQITNESFNSFGIGLNMVKNICDEENIIINLNSDKFITTFEYIFSDHHTS